jgi:TonB family protein
MNLLAIALLLSVPTALTAQTITGSVYDPSGAIVVGARVMLMLDYVKLTETISDAAGQFTFDHLDRKLYHVQIKQPRFSLFQSHVDLRERGSAHVIAVLPLASMDETVQIRGDLPGVSSGAKPPTRAAAGGRVQPARPAHRTYPAYPEGAKRRGVRGAVAIHIRIQADGRVADPMVLDTPDAELSTAALAAVKDWTYEPMRLNEAPVACDATIVLEFGGS